MNRIVIGLVAFILGIGLGGIGGFFVGAASTDFGGELLKSAFSSEKAADVANPKSISRTHFTLQFPGNWKEDPSFDVGGDQHFFLLKSEAGSYASFQVQNEASNTQDVVEENVALESEGLSQITKTPFSKWGQYQGTGVEIKGRALGYYSSRVRIFSYSSNNKSFLVIEQHYNEDSALTTPGFQLIERTFKLKNP